MFKSVTKAALVILTRMCTEVKLQTYKFLYSGMRSCHKSLWEAHILLLSYEEFKCGLLLFNE